MVEASFHPPLSLVILPAKQLVLAAYSGIYTLRKTCNFPTSIKTSHEEDGWFRVCLFVWRFSLFIYFGLQKFIVLPTSMLSGLVFYD